ncbi:unnamed protein product [Microthlaspi erraticum]|uniref:MATH domain-containing protein n=1 Tax=Microthlaspi erraticum TaxID=1685480 RepID=A0A6D2IR88_9BRAS|nr:unnamed protein product [Microthlaspi erraticum]
MEEQKHTSFTFEINNFSDKEGFITSPKFSSGGCEWYVGVYPKGYNVDDHLSLYLHVANPGTLRLGWKRRANYSFLLLNQSSGKELYRTPESPCQLFCAQFSSWGRPKAVSLKKLQEKGCLEKNKLIVKVEIKVVSVDRLFRDHPNIAVNVRPKNQLVKTTYMNLLLALIDTLNKPPHSITDTELSNAQSELMELTDAAGFKLDWLKTKLHEISLERKKANADGSRARELEEQIQNLKAELKEEKLESHTCSAKVLSLEQTVSELKDELNKEKGKSDSYADKLVSLEQTVSDLKYELNKEKGKSDTYAAKVVSLEQTLSDLSSNQNKKRKVTRQEFSRAFGYFSS